MFFVLEDSNGVVYGCSNVIAHHGSPEAPHTYFDVIEEDRYSRDLERLFSHLVLWLGTSFHPRTEIGGLVLNSSHRGQGVASLLSRSRFQYIAAYRERFASASRPNSSPLSTPMAPLLCGSLSVGALPAWSIERQIAFPSIKRNSSKISFHGGISMSRSSMKRPTESLALWVKKPKQWSLCFAERAFATNGD